MIVVWGYGADEQLIVGYGFGSVVILPTKQLEFTTYVITTLEL